MTPFLSSPLVQSAHAQTQKHNYNSAGDFFRGKK